MARGFLHVRWSVSALALLLAGTAASNALPAGRRAGRRPPPAPAPPHLERPWLHVADRLTAARDALEKAGDPSELSETIARAFALGDYEQVARRLQAERDADAVAQILPGLGLTASPKGLRPALEQSPSSAPPSTLPPLDEETRTSFLRRRFARLRLVNKSTYFDIHSDRKAGEIQPYTDLLNDYFRNLRNRFRARLLGNVTVFLFGNRSDYLLVHAILFGKSGEHMLGFYIPRLRNLYFYDDPDDFERVAGTARHECSHLLLDLFLEGKNAPRWLHEGFASFLEGGGLERRGRGAMGLLLQAQRDLASGAGLPVERLLDTRSTAFEYRHYAWSWALLQCLESNAETEGRLMDLLERMREALPEGDKPNTMYDAARRAFLETYDWDFEQLDDELATFLTEVARLERNDQRLDFALEALRRASASDKKSERRDFVDLARTLAADLPVTGDRATERSLLSLEARVARADLTLEEGDEAAAWLLLRDVRDAFEACRSSDAVWRLAEAVGDAIATASRAAGVERPAGEPCDSIARLRARASDSWRPALAGLAEELLERTFWRLAERLSADPFHERTLRAWTRLAYRHRPERLREVFGRVVTLVEHDPHDINHATLALCYGGLGHRAAARLHALQAARFSVQPAEIAEYLAMLGVEDPAARRAGRRASSSPRR